MMFEWLIEVQMFFDDQTLMKDDIFHSIFFWKAILFEFFKFIRKVPTYQLFLTAV